MMMTALALIAAAAPAAVEIRFCPAARARSYPLDSAHDATSLVVQGIAVVNHSAQPVTLDRVVIDLLRGSEAVDTRQVGGADLARAAAGGHALAASGLMASIGFQFCDGALLRAAGLAGTATLAPGEALLLTHQSFAWRGRRDVLRVSAAGASATIPIDGSFAAPIRWPLRGGPWTIAGASFHTSHRWAVPEQFALDIVRVGADGLTHRGDGARLADYHAYGEAIVAVGDGTVVGVTRAAGEDAPLLRRSGEGEAAYLDRVSAAQAPKLAAGEAAVLGESVILDLGGGVFAVYAHLKPNSATVRPGERVRTGQRIGALGNSGNSTEPHLHFQLCDRPSGLSCAGIPPAFDGIDLPFAEGPRPLQSGDVVLAR